MEAWRKMNTVVEKTYKTKAYKTALIDKRWYAVFDSSNNLLSEGYHTGEVSAAHNISLFDTEKKLQDKLKDLKPKKEVVIVYKEPKSEVIIK